MPSIDDIDSLGSVINEDIQLVRRVPKFSVPGTSSATTFTVGFLGVTRILSIQGLFKGTVAEQDTFVTDVEEWVNGGNVEGRTYTDSLGNTYNVRCFDFLRVKDNRVGGRLLYTMVMIEGL